MLRNIRSMTRTWVAGLFIGLLVVAAALFGLSDTLRPTLGSNLAKGRDVSVTLQEFTTAWNAYLSNIRQSDPTQTASAALARGDHTVLLDDIATDKSLDAVARRAGVIASEGQIDRLILERYPAFRNPFTGVYDKEIAARLLRENRIRASDLREDTGLDIARLQVLRAVTGGLRPPSAFGRIAQTYFGETRVLSIVAVPIERVAAPPAPTEAQLQALYAELRDQRYAVGERRSFTVVLATPESVGARLAAALPEADVRKAYEDNIRQFETPELRTLDQVTAPDETKAAEAARRIASGEAPAAVALAIGGAHVRHNRVSRKSFPDAAAADSAFSLAQGATSPPVQGLSWSVLRVSEIVPAVRQPFESVKAQVALGLVAAEARREATRAISAFEQAPVDAPYAQAAAASGLEALEVVAVDAAGRALDGAAVDPRSVAPAILAAAQAAAPNEKTAFFPLPGGGDFALQLNAVLPPYVRPFEEVRADLEATWRRQELAAAQARVAAEMEAAIRAGRSLPAAAVGARLPVLARSQPLDRSALQRLDLERQARPAEFPPRGRHLLELAFAAREGSVVSAPDGERAGAALMVVHVEAMRRPELATESPQVETARQSAEAALQNNVLSGARATARAAAALRFNTAALNRAVSADQAGN